MLWENHTQYLKKPGHGRSLPFPPSNQSWRAGGRSHGTTVAGTGTVPLRRLCGARGENLHFSSFLSHVLRAGPFPPPLWAPLLLTCSADAQDPGRSSCSKSSCSGELPLELRNGGSSLWLSQGSPALLWSVTRGGAATCGATADTESGVSEGPAAPRSGHGENAGANR